MFVKKITDQDVVDAMHIYGSNFVHALSYAYSQADDKNRARIKAAWPEVWELYTLFITAKRKLPK